MFKALLKKQMLELNAVYFQNKKTGKQRTRVGTTLFIGLFVLLFLFLGVSFYFLSTLLAEALVPAGMGWFYFAIMATVSLFLGVFGGVFNTYAALYNTKDNELLLSMPIPPRTILTVRMVGAYLMNLLYEALVYVPATIAFFVYGTPTFLSVLNCVLLLFILNFFGLVLTCLLGWLVALIAGKLKSKSFLTVLIALVFFGIYYYICFNYMSLVEKIIADSVAMGEKVKGAAYPLYVLGRAAEGDMVSLLLYTAGVAVLLALTWYILSKTFLHIALRRESGTKTVYREQTAKVGNTDTALFRKEWKRFSSSATYMLNCALGTVLMPIGAVALLIYSGTILDFLIAFELPEKVLQFLPVVAVAMVCMIVSMNCITAPSISLDGKTLWIMQSMPVDSRKILNAKLRLHELLTIPPALFLTVVLAWILRADLSTAIMMNLVVLLYVMLIASSGLAFNLKRPNLTWTNETVPIKQGSSVVFCLFGGWLISILIGVGGYFATKVMDGYLYLLLVGVIVLAFPTRFLNGWLRTDGAKILDHLS